MTQKEFIQKVREIKGKTDFNCHVEHFIKVGTVTVINFVKIIEKKARSPPAYIGNNWYIIRYISMWSPRLNDVSRAGSTVISVRELLT